MATEIWVNIGSGNGLLPDGTKPLPEPITYLKLHSNFPGASELITEDVLYATAYWSSVTLISFITPVECMIASGCRL